MDNRFTKEESFRLSLITGHLPTLDKVITFNRSTRIDATCLRCHVVIETNQHILESSIVQLCMIILAAIIEDSIARLCAGTPQLNSISYGKSKIYYDNVGMILLDG
jgi:hypothetical protein